MASFPFFRSPYNNYYYRYYPNYNANHNSIPENAKNTEDASTVDKENVLDNTRRKNEKKSEKKNGLEDPIFEILGIYIYLDDLIILGLLFFLYTENVHDEILFMTLILLLLS